MKKYSLFFLLVMVLFSSCHPSLNNQSVSVKIEAIGKIEVQPDIAEFIVIVNCVNKNIKASNTCLKNRINKVFGLFKTFEINKEDFHSSRVNLNKEYFWKNGTQVFRGYRSSTTIAVKIKDLDTLGELLASLMSQTDLSLTGLAYSHSNIDDLANDSYIKALENSKRLAEKIRNKIGGKAIEIVEINNTAEPVFRDNNTRFLKQEDSSGAGPVNVNIGTLVLQKNIKVHYRIVK